jgi:hypothetical protein
MAANLAAIVSALERAGVRFIFEPEEFGAVIRREPK